MVKSYQADLLIDYYYLDVTYKDSKLIHSYFSFEIILDKRLKTKCLLTSPSNVLPLHLKQTFPPIILIFNEGEGNGIEFRLLYCTLLLAMGVIIITLLNLYYLDQMKKMINQKNSENCHLLKELWQF